MKVWLVGAAAGLGLAATLMTVETTPDAPREPLRADGTPIRIEVLNGSNVNGAGLALAEELRADGFDVVDIRNADRSDYEQTIVLDRVGVIDYAFAVAERIHGPEPRSQPEDTLLLEVTVILGRDCARRYGGNI
jgi:hypothetical protein